METLIETIALPGLSSSSSVRKIPRCSSATRHSSRTSSFRTGPSSGRVGSRSRSTSRRQRPRRCASSSSAAAWVSRRSPLLQEARACWRPTGRTTRSDCFRRTRGETISSSRPRGATGASPGWLDATAFDLVLAADLALRGAQRGLRSPLVLDRVLESGARGLDRRSRSPARRRALRGAPSAHHVAAIPHRGAPARRAFERSRVVSAEAQLVRATRSATISRSTATSPATSSRRAVARAAASRGERSAPPRRRCEPRTRLRRGRRRRPGRGGRAPRRRRATAPAPPRGPAPTTARARPRRRTDVRS